MILVDTGPLVALCETRDRLHSRAKRELAALGHDTRAVSLPVLVEAHFLLREAHLRARLKGHLESGAFAAAQPDDAARCLRDALSWLQAYAEHRPDFADAWLIAMVQQSPASIWSFDSEFETTWRMPDGTKVPRAPTPTRRR